LSDHKLNHREAEEEKAGDTILKKRKSNSTREKKIKNPSELKTDDFFEDEAVNLPHTRKHVKSNQVNLQGIKKSGSKRIQQLRKILEVLTNPNHTNQQ